MPDELQRRAAALKVPFVDLTSAACEPEVVELIPEALSRRYRLIPFARRGDRVLCAMEDPLDLAAIDDLRIRTGVDISPALCNGDALEQAWTQAYGQHDPWKDLIADAEQNVEWAADSDREEDDGLIREGGRVVVEQPIVLLVNKILQEAIVRRASDIHIEPFEREIVVRFRIDGVLQRMPFPLPRTFLPAVVARIKIMTSLKIDERRLPQDGRMHLVMRGATVDLRVSTVPTRFGESVVMRILDRRNMQVDLSALGFHATDLAAWQRAVQRPHGVLLVTGPTGSGKTTTLYSTLNQLNQPDVKILTVEDPIEYELNGVVQVQVNHRIGLDFAAALRAFLRQDPDVIMVGEIRDRETAGIAVESALTGHQVLTSLHTNDAVSSVVRLIDMGVEPFLIASTLNAVLAQRLVRRICSECAEEVPTPSTTREVFAARNQACPATLRQGRGCSVCHATGFRGRLGIYELLAVSDALRDLVLRRVPSHALLAQAREEGLTLLFDDGLRKVAEGETTLAEVVSVTAE